MTALFRIALLLVLSLPALAARAETNLNCEVVELAGNDAVVDQGDRQLAATPGLAIQPGDLISTGPDTYLVLRCDGVQVALGGGTTYRVEDPAVAGSPAGSTLFSGIVGVIKRAIDRPFTVKTDRLVAAVRSTEWIVSNDDEGDAVFVREGEVVVDIRGVSSAMLSSGEGIDVSGTGTAAVRTWSAERVARTNALLPLGWQ